MAHRKKKPPPKAPLEFPVESVLGWANQAYLAKERFLRLASRWSVRRREALSTFAMSLWRRRLDERGVLGRLLKALREVPAFQAEKISAARARQKAENDATANRKALAEVAKRHPKGRLIGSTQTIGYKSPGERKHWGTPRKRRG